MYLHVFMCFVLANGSICVCIHVFLEFHTCTICRHTVWFLSTVCHQFSFVTGLLLVHYSVLCVLC